MKRTAALHSKILWCLATRRVVAGMATMPSRLDTFPAAFASIIAQVNHLYLYLDGHSEVPDAAKNHPRVTLLFADQFPGLHGNGKFIGLLLEKEDCLYVGVDDDIIYPRNYVARLRAGLASYAGRALVGYHGSAFTQPFVSYTQNRKVHGFDQKLAHRQKVNALGSGTVMFDTAALRFDVRKWTEVDMADLYLAIEATSAGLPLVCLERRGGFIRALEVMQPDSIYLRLLRDDTRQTKLALQLQAMQSRPS